VSQAWIVAPAVAGFAIAAAGEIDSASPVMPFA